MIQRRLLFRRRDNRILDVFLRYQYGLDLDGFYSVAAEAQLKIRTAQMIKTTVRAQPP